MSGAQAIEGVGVAQPEHSIFDIAVMCTDENGNGLSGTPLEGLSYSNNVDNPTDRRWSSGVKFSPEGCTCPSVWPRTGDCDLSIASCAETYSSWPVAAGAQTIPPEVAAVSVNGKEDPCDVCSSVVFNPFTIYYPEGCLDNIPQGVDYEARARRALEAYEAAQINRELATGFSSGNPSLWSTARDIVTGVPLPAFDLLKAFAGQAEKHGGPGELIVHSPSWTAGSFTRDRLAFFVGEDGAPNGRAGWRTPHGFMLNTYSGLTGTDALVAPAAFEPNLTDPWAYLTGRVWVAKGPIRFAEDSDRRHHRVTTPGELVQQAAGEKVTAERELLVFFNPCLSWGAPLDASI